jgi:hypothetical protein
LVNIENEIDFYNLLAKDGERAKPIRHDAQRGVQAPFEGDPTYRSRVHRLIFLLINSFFLSPADYRKWDTGRTEAIRPDAAYVRLPR